MSQVGPLAAQLTHQYAQLAADSGGAAVSTANPEVSSRLAASVQELGRACLNTVSAAGSVQASPADSLVHRDLSDSVRLLSEKVIIVFDYCFYFFIHMLIRLPFLFKI